MDIAHDRAGYYLCWGCLNWVPAIYTSPALHLASHPVHLGTPLALAIFLAGAASVFINYDSDRQRQVSWHILLWHKCFWRTRSLTEISGHLQSLITRRQVANVDLPHAQVRILHAELPRMVQVFRESGGKTNVWRRSPKIIRASYATGDGSEKKSLLLASGQSAGC